jgi:hypothetical protein
MPRRRALFWLAFTMPLLGCSEHTAIAHLIRISSVQQIWEQPNQLSLRGEGFPPGMRGEALLDGTLFAPGAAPQVHRLRVPCRALSSTQALVDLKVPAVSSLPEGPFSGALEVSFGAQPDARLVGRVERTLFRLAGGQSQLQVQFALSRRAQDFQHALGITALELSEHGPVVSELAAGGASQHAGLSVGDAIVRLNGAPVQLPVDVLPRGELALVELEVRRPREASLQVLRIALDSPGGPLDFQLWVLCCGLGASLTALAAKGLRALPRAKPKRKEFWLACSSALCLGMVCMFVLESTAPSIRDACQALACGALVSCLGVYLLRRARRTLRTARDPALTPFL